MSKNNISHELQAILNVIAQSPHGISLRDIEEKLTLSLPYRTLQRRMASLVNEKRIMMEGSHRAIRYTLWKPDAELDINIPLSTAAIKIRQHIRKPLFERATIDYNRTFLDHYQPNVTRYLSASLEQHLTTIGKTSSQQQPAGTYAKHILQRVLIDLAWNSSRLEGNTYSLLETERLLLNNERADHKNAAETQMILNHQAAIEFLVEMADEVQFNPYTILNLHALLSHNLLADPLACGRLRTIPVSIGKAAYRPPTIPALIEECFQQILYKATHIHAVFERSFFIMVHLPYLQPFEDVNKRVSRLAANIPLIQHNLSPLSFIDVPERAYIDSVLGVYELNKIDLLRDLFVWAYERSAARYATAQQQLGEPDPFRLRYHAHITQAITTTILQQCDKKAADLHIKQYAANHFIGPDIHQFVNVVETELNALHTGNIARYRISLKQFMLWQKNWF